MSAFPASTDIGAHIVAISSRWFASASNASVIADPVHSEVFACLSQIYTDGHRLGFAPGESVAGLRRQAAEFAQRAIDLAPNSSRGYHAQGLAHWFLQDVAPSLEALQTALKLNPNATEVAADLGLYWSLLGDWDRGICLLRQALEQDPLQAELRPRRCFALPLCEWPLRESPRRSEADSIAARHLRTGVQGHRTRAAWTPRGSISVHRSHAEHQSALRQRCAGRIGRRQYRRASRGRNRNRADGSRAHQGNRLRRSGFSCPSWGCIVSSWGLRQRRPNLDPGEQISFLGLSHSGPFVTTDCIPHTSARADARDHSKSTGVKWRSHRRHRKRSGRPMVAMAVSARHGAMPAIQARVGAARPSAKETAPAPSMEGRARSICRLDGIGGGSNRGRIQSLCGRYGDLSYISQHGRISQLSTRALYQRTA